MDFSVIQNNLWIVALLAIWELIWKGLGLWRAAKNNQTHWFVAMLVLNTVGILPILYIKFFQKKREGNVQCKTYNVQLKLT